MPAGWVSVRVRAIEPWALVALSFAMAATAIFLWPGLPVSWALALVPLLAARWAQSGPGRHQSELALRGTLVVAGVLLLQLHQPADAGAATLLTQAWLGAACATYAFLLRARWACGVTVFAFLVLGTVRLLHAGESPQAMPLFTDALALVLPALLAAVPGAALRRADARRECGRIDPASGLCSLEGLRAYGEDVLARCRHRGQPVTLAVFDCSDLLEVRHIYGPPVARRLALRVTQVLSQVAGERGLAARTGVAEFAVLLPGLDRERALRAIQQVLGSPSRVEYESGGSEIVLVPDLMLVQAGHDDDIASLHGAASRRLVRDREVEARRHRYLRAERERHSRPMSVPGHDAMSARERALAPTAPMPLTAAR
ncbi:GGDEF domain-containing protein [Ramlibacter sp. Leaf400]|uniref:GGDEF domain-containing protein n=1 Tax=Ramlibacter sp. Leaf400 TaxID=1736365 RepID=UPI0006FEA2EE|nr:GGDEF domain-containing protein [Ramlibacter sp. Leaf400]KQT10618.1 hypothetical protein ASG30_07315 [Ramlibacter sp. Leaf400]